ncbi:MAG: DUF1697 domain-containing protein [Moheibacter sp.]
MKNTGFIVLLRGINVGGHHKVPMAELRQTMEKMGFTNVSTLLNSGNVIFETKDKVGLESEIEFQLERTFGFEIPVMLRKFDEIQQMVQNNPFERFKADENTKFYVSFVKNKPDNEIDLPFFSEDKSFQIIEIRDKTVFGILDLSKGSTVKGMEVLQSLFGKDLTTRNWNTIVKCSEKMNF